MTPATSPIAMKSMKKPFPLLALAALLAAQTPPSLAGPVLDRIRQSGKIVLAHRDSSVPLSYIDSASGKPMGYALDLCLKVADAVKHQLNLPKLEVAYLPVTAANRMQAIVEGKADLECGSTTNNAERRQQVAFTIPHYITGARILVHANTKFDKINDFEHKKLAITKGTTVLKAVQHANEERLLYIDVVETPSHAAAMDMLDKGQVDGFAMDDVLLYGLRSERPDPEKYKVIGSFLTIEPLAIMLSKNDPEFKALVDAEMKRLITSHEAYAIYDRWFIKPIPPRNVSLNMPMNYLLRDFWKYPSDMVPN